MAPECPYFGDPPNSLLSTMNLMVRESQSWLLSQDQIVSLLNLGYL